MKLYTVACKRDPELVEVEAVEKPKSYKIDGRDSAWGYRQLIRKDELHNLRIADTPGEAIAMAITHRKARVSTCRAQLVRAQDELYAVLDLERRFNAEGSND